MCGRYSLNTTAAEFGRHFGLEVAQALLGRANIAPTQELLIVAAAAVAETPTSGADGGAAGAALEPRPTPGRASRRAILVRWGLVPVWAKEEKPAGIINARAETAATKPAFRSAFRRRRCLVPASGFYEWQKAPAGAARTTKIPFHIHLRHAPLLAFAGLLEPWRQPDGQTLLTCAILTTTANDLVRPIHDRMPVILPPERYDAWLDPAAADVGALEALLQPYPAEAMAAEPDTAVINSPRNSPKSAPAGNTNAVNSDEALASKPRLSGSDGGIGGAGGKRDAKGRKTRRESEPPATLFDAEPGA